MGYQPGALENLEGIDFSLWRDRPVLVTGATGLLGLNLCQALRRLGARVIALVRDAPLPDPFTLFGLEGSLVIVRGRVEDQALHERILTDYSVSVVFHLAAQTLVGPARQNPTATFETNIAGTWRLLEACRRHPVQACLLASSDKAYGAQPQLPYREEFPLLAGFPYDASKACAEILARSYSQTYQLPIGITRCANLYGPGDLNLSRLIPGTLHAMLRGEAPVLRSDGSPERDYMHVSDAVRAYLLFAASLLAGNHHGEAFNFGTGQPCSLMALMQALTGACRQADFPPILPLSILADTRAEIDRQYLDSSRAQARLGWNAQVPLAQGLRETAIWYRDHRAALGW